MATLGGGQFGAWNAVIGMVSCGLISALEGPVCTGFNFAGQQVFGRVFQIILRVHVICFSRACPAVNPAIALFNNRSDKSSRLLWRATFVDLIRLLATALDVMQNGPHA